MRACWQTKRTFSTKPQKWVVGCGSNVVDIFHRVQSLPKAGEKGFFLNPMEPISGEIVGGVTLNHLCWAHLLNTNVAIDWW